MTDLLVPIRSFGNRIALASAVAVYLALAFFAIKWGLGNAVAARADLLEAAALAVQWAPDDPETNFVAAQLLEDTFDPEDAAASLEYYERTASLSPNNYLRWLDLGRARERSGDPEGAEMAYRRALELAPHYSLPQWALGNALLRQGRPDEAFAEIRKAVAGDPQYTGVAASTAWAYFDGDIDAVRSAIGDSIELRAALALLLSGQERFKESQEIWSSLPIERRRNDLAETGRSLSGLFLSSRQYHAALQIANDISEPDSIGARLGQITNGGFEHPLLAAEKAGAFDWRIETGTRPAVGPSEDQRLDGRYSLIVLFGKEPHADFREISQLVAVEPGGRYLLSYNYRSAIQSNAGFRWVIVNPATNETLAGGEPIEPNTDWQNGTLSFTAPTAVDGIIIKFIRDGCTGKACETSGSIWFDDFSLGEVGNGE